MILIIFLIQISLLILSTIWAYSSGDFVLFIIYGVLFFLVQRSYHRHRQERYALQRHFTLWIQLTVFLLLFIFFLSVFCLFKYIPISSPTIFLGCIFLSLAGFLTPSIAAQSYILFHPSMADKELRILKKLDPVHPLFQRLWQNTTSLSKRVLLISLEPDALVLPVHVKTILGLWIQGGLLSPLTLIDPHKRNFYSYLKTSQIHTIRIVLGEDTETICTFSIETEGNFTGEELMSTKSKSKLYEHFSHARHPIRSMFFDAKTSRMLFEFYRTFPEDEKAIIELAQSIELAFTELEMHTLSHQYPSLQAYTIMDQEEGAEPQMIYSIRMRYHLPPGLSTEMFTAQKIAQIASYVRLPFYKHRLKPHEDIVDFFIELKPRDISSLHFDDFPAAKKLRIPLGFDLIWRRTVFINFEQENMEKSDPGFTPHMIIAGATASGKSNFIKFFITSLLRTHTPETLRLFLVDPKVVSFSIFKNIPHLYAPIVSDALKFKTVLSGIVQEVERRYKILAEAGVENLPQLEKSRPDLMKDFPRILVIVDEFADIIDAHSWKIREDINLILKRLGQKARAAGVHMILITQRATSANIDGEIKANLPGRIAFRVASEGDSQVILSDGVAAHIENPGEGYAQLGEASELVHFQSPYITDTDIKKVLSHFDGVPQRFIDQQLSDDLMRQPLLAKDVTFHMLPVEPFPSVALGIDLETHLPISLFFGSVNKFSNVEPTPHAVIAGATNAGKSQFAKLLVYKLIQEATPDELRLILIDPKAVTFVPFKKIPHLACPLVTEHKLLLPILRSCLEEIEYRYKLFAEHAVENIEVYRMRTGKILPSLFIIIDEFADLLDYFPYKERDEIEKILKRYGQMARAAGIHLILITQRATAQNIPGELRANLSGKVALRMYSEADSHYLLEEAGAEKITEPGVFLLKRGSNAPIRGYAPLIHKEDIEKLVSLALETFGEARYEPRLEKILSDIQIDDIINATKAGLIRKGFFE